jgi:hypothetical protein
MVFGDPFRRKRARVVRVRAVAEQQITPTMRAVVSGEGRPNHTVTVPTSVGGQAKEKFIRVAGQGTPIQVEITNAGAGTRIEAIGVDAEILRSRP